MFTTGVDVRPKDYNAGKHTTSVTHAKKPETSKQTTTMTHSKKPETSKKITSAAEKPSEKSTSKKSLFEWLFKKGIVFKVFLFHMVY